MDTQDHKKNHTPGNEGHEVHVCHNCGWHFPNPHPSAKQRRAHKKVCGTIKGYKQVGSEETAHLAVPHGEQHSVEDPKTPSPNILQSSANEKDIGLSDGLGKISNRSEEEVFADAVTEFVDSGSSPGTDERLKDVKEPAIEVETFSENSVINPQIKSAESCQIQSTEVQGVNLSRSAQETHDHISNTGLTPIALTDGKTGESTTDRNDDLGFLYVYPVKLEAQAYALLENKEKNAGDGLSKTDAKADTLNRDQLTDVALPVVNASETSDVSLHDLSPEPKSVESMIASVDSAEISVAVAQVIASSGNSIEGQNGKEDGKAIMHVFSVPDEIPAVDNAEMGVKGFKDHEGGKLPQFVDADLFELSNDVQESILDDNDSSSSRQRSLEEGTAFSALGMHVLSANIEQKGESNEVVFQQFRGEGEGAALQSSNKVSAVQISEESGAIANNGVIETEKCCNVQSLENATTVMSDMDPVVTPTDPEVGQTTSFVGKDIAGDHITGNDHKRIAGECSSELTVPHSEATSLHSLVPARNNLRGDNFAADTEGDKIKRYEVSESENDKGESASGLVEESLSNKSNLHSESDSSIHVSSENANSDKFPEPEYTNSDSISDSQEGIKELHSCGNDVQMEHVGGVRASAQSNDGVIELIQKSPNNEFSSKPLVSPSDISSSIHNSVTVEGDHPKGFAEVASGDRSKSLLNESDQSLVAQQLGASAGDLAVDFSSRTDSLEGHWGSVSVLSTQSDIPAFADSESFPANGYQATEAASEKSSLSKPKSPSAATQQADESDIFEPPSFMTLVETKDVSSQNPAASEIQTVQNPEAAASVQAGWFPSINHAVHASEGRKKNEEIIAKVTNWSTGRQHIPLKSLLGEAVVETKPRTSNAKETSSPVVQKDESSKNDNGSVAAKVSSVLGPQEPVKIESGKEWNSPARYPPKIKGEKKKVKGRWAQFVCCSSVN